MEINLRLYTEEEISVVMQALNYYMYNRPMTTEEQWEIADKVLERMDGLI